MKKIIIAFLLAAVAVPAAAADLPFKAPIKTSLLQPRVLDLTDWTGFYAGMSMTGMNQGADVINGGLSSVNAGGQLLGLHVGAMTVNKTYLLGVDGMLAYQPNMGADTVLDNARWNGRVDMRAGGSLANLIGTIQPPANGGIFNFGTMFANMMPYAHMGDLLRGSTSQAEGGMGVYIPLRGNLFMTSEYTYGAPAKGLQAFQGVTVAVNWAF